MCVKSPLRGSSENFSACLACTHLHSNENFREDSILAAGIPTAAALMSAGEGRAAKMWQLLLIERPICGQLFCLVLYLYHNLNSNINYVFVCLYVF